MNDGGIIRRHQTLEVLLPRHALSFVTLHNSVERDPFAGWPLAPKLSRSPIAVESNHVPPVTEAGRKLPCRKRPPKPRGTGMVSTARFRIHVGPVGAAGTPPADG